MPNDFQSNLERYAELSIKVWLNVQPGQRLLILAPLETAELVRLLLKYAYQNGSPFVEVVWSDDLSTRLRYEYASRTSFAEYSVATFESLKTTVERGGALISIAAQDPDLLQGLDGEFIAAVAKSSAALYNDLNVRIQRNELSWLVLGMPIPSWAARVFPDAAPSEQMDKLWQAIFQVCRMYEPDPVEAWRKHIANLQSRLEWMNSQAYTALHYTGPGTDLTLYLPRGHNWVGAREVTTQGIAFTPNIPTEEIFTAPDKDRTEGIVTTTKPLVVRGEVIDRFTLTFEKGRVVKVDASNSQQVLEDYIATDAGAARLGEVALVPNSNPISKLGITFYNTLFDENAASHLALGRAFPNNVEGGER